MSNQIKNSNLNAMSRISDQDGSPWGIGWLASEGKMRNRLAFATIGIAFLTGILLSLWGLWNLNWHENSWTQPGLKRYVGFLLVCSLIVFKGSKSIRCSPLATGVFFTVVLALLTGNIWPLFVAVWFGVACAVSGKAVLAALRAVDDDTDWMSSFLTGAGLYGTAVGILAYFPVNYPGVYEAALAAPLILARRSVRELSDSLRGWLSDRTAGPSVSRLETAIAVVALLYFLVALMPETGFDALAMHLFVPAHLKLRHQWEFNADYYAWAVMPMLGEWIFGIGHMLAGETAARLINAGFILSLGWLAHRAVVWAGGSAREGKWAALIFLSMPLAFAESASLHIESVWAAFIVAGTLHILRADERAGTAKSALFCAAIMLGCAAAAKAVTLPLLPIFLLLLVFRSKSWLKAGIYPMLTAAGLFIAIGAIPYVTAYWLTGNPVFPFFNGLFRSPYYPPYDFKGPAVFGKGLNWDVLYQITFDSHKFLESRDGAAGFQWLPLLLPAALSLLAYRHRKGLALLLAGVSFVAVTFHFTAYLRYVFPSTVLLTALVGVALSRWRENHAVLHKLGVLIAGTVVLLNLYFFSAAIKYGDFPISSVEDDARKSYLMQRLPLREAVQALNHLNIGQAPVAAFTQPQTAGLQADALYSTWYNFRFQSQINDSRTEDAMADTLLGRGVNFVMLDKNWGTPEKRTLIENVTEKIMDFGPISIRTMREAYRFKHELIKHPDLANGDDWVLAAGSSRIPEGVIVNASSPASLEIPVMPGTRYLNTVKARCESQATQGIMRVDWLDSKSRFMNTNTRTFDCSTLPSEYSMEVIAPEEAAFALVYASGNTPVPLVFEEVSFRR